MNGPALAAHVLGLDPFPGVGGALPQPGLPPPLPRCGLRSLLAACWRRAPLERPRVAKLLDTLHTVGLEKLLQPDPPAPTKAPKGIQKACEMSSNNVGPGLVGPRRNTNYMINCLICKRINESIG